MRRRGDCNVLSGAKDVAEDDPVTHSFLVSEAFVGMMVTPSVRLVRPLGEGGMGAVWVADHLALRTQVVVKFIAHGLKGSRDAQERFSREAAAASQVKSPHVVQTFDHGITDEGIPYIVMELLDGRDLGAYLDEQGKVPPELAIEILGQLSRALDRAHEKGIIHRDIKPGNIFLCDAGAGSDESREVFVKLLDFGIAKGVDMLSEGGTGIDSGTKTGAMVGSPFYMSPEQILGSKTLDKRSDVWSVGVVAYEMLTGKKPFDAETMGGLAIRIHSEPLPKPSLTNPELPSAIDAWFEAACARDVERRYTSAKELTTELARALGGQLSRGVPASLDAPRISSSSGARTIKDPPVLTAGAATDAGVVASTVPHPMRSRLLLLVAIIVVVSTGAFVAARALRRDPTVARVPPAPSFGAMAPAALSARAEPSASPTTNLVALTPSASAGVPLVPEPAPTNKPLRPGRKPVHSAITAASSPPPSSPLPSSTPAPPPTPPPTPKPSSSDIY